MFDGREECLAHLKNGTNGFFDVQRKSFRNNSRWRRTKIAKKKKTKTYKYIQKPTFDWDVFYERMTVFLMCKSCSPSVASGKTTTNLLIYFTFLHKEH